VDSGEGEGVSISGCASAGGFGAAAGLDTEGDNRLPSSSQAMPRLMASVRHAGSTIENLHTAASDFEAGFIRLESDPEKELAPACQLITANRMTVENVKKHPHMRVMWDETICFDGNIMRRPLMGWDIKVLWVKLPVLLAVLLLPFTPAAAVEDGAYAGFYQVTFAVPETGEQKGNTGELILVIEDNEIIDIQYEEDDFVRGKVTYKLKIDEKSGKLKGYFSETGRRQNGAIMNLRWSMKGVFVDKYFAGKADIYITQWNGQTPESGMLKVASYVFESP